MPGGRLPDGLFQRVEQGGAGARVVERFARRVEHRHAAFGEEEPHRRFHLVQPLADPATHPCVLLGRGAHQGDLRVVFVEQAVLVCLGDGRRGAEVDHIERADRADVGHPGADHRAETVLGRGEDPAEHHVADFGRGGVDDAFDHATLDQFFHRLAADAGGVEDEAIVGVL